MMTLLAQVDSAQLPDKSVGPFDLNLLDWTGWGIQVRVGLFWLVVAVGLAAALRWLWPLAKQRWLKGYHTRSVKLSFKGVELDICPDTETRRVAHQAWVEIKSRKVGLPFEEGQDVIAEVYKSWYQLFGVLRDLAKSIPADRLQDCDETRNLVALLMRALNEGLRPHLTKWSARFRRWYDAALENEQDKGKSPQEIQKGFPEYDELVADLRRVSNEFVTFADSLQKIVEDGE
ncbi:MAG TPA: hypothetical protein VM487_05650 [Phycisphaerae bacterium]|nr:hypothetical protein [Phycisphaerae bacterium]